MATPMMLAMVMRMVRPKVMTSTPRFNTRLSEIQPGQQADALGCLSQKAAEHDSCQQQ